MSINQYRLETISKILLQSSSLRLMIARESWRHVTRDIYIRTSNCSTKGLSWILYFFFQSLVDMFGATYRRYNDVDLTLWSLLVIYLSISGPQRLLKLREDILCTRITIWLTILPIDTPICEKELTLQEFKWDWQQANCKVDLMYSINLLARKISNRIISGCKKYQIFTKLYRR